MITSTNNNTLQRSNKMTKQTKETSGLTYFLNGLLVFLALAFDAIQGVIDTLIYGDLVAERFWDSPWYVLVTHWTFVIIIWGLTFYFMSRWIKRNGREHLIQVKWTKNIMKWALYAIIASVLLSLLEQLIEPTRLPQIYREYLSFKNAHGEMGFVVSLFQNVYYIFETLMVVLLVILMQLAGETWFKKQSIPWGSIGLAITWGIAHLTHGGIATLWISLFALLAGTFYVICKRHILPSYIFILLIFVI